MSIIVASRNAELLAKQLAEEFHRPLPGPASFMIGTDERALIAKALDRLAAKPDDEGSRTIWVAKAPSDQLYFNRVYEREPSAKIKEEHERCGWKIVELKIRELSTTGEPKP